MDQASSSQGHGLNEKFALDSDQLDMRTDTRLEIPLAAPPDLQRSPSLQPNDQRSKRTQERPLNRNLSDSGNLDLLRATAVTLVLVSHIFEVFGSKRYPLMHNW